MRGQPRRLVRGALIVAIYLTDTSVLKEDVLRCFKIVVERYPDGYVGYPLGLKGVVVGQGETYEAALADVKSAVQFHIETFGTEAWDEDFPVLEAFLIDEAMAV